MKKIIMLAGMLSIVATASSVLAANNAGVITLTGAAASYHFDPNRKLNTAVMPNAALAYNATEKLAVEAGYGSISTNINNGGTEHVNLYMVDGIYRFAVKGYFQPYVIAGVAVMSVIPQIRHQLQVQSMVNAGLGTQFFMDEVLALRAEVRDLHTISSAGRNDVMLNFGISYLFGG